MMHLVEYSGDFQVAWILKTCLEVGVGKGAQWILDSLTNESRLFKKSPILYLPPELLVLYRVVLSTIIFLRHYNLKYKKPQLS